MPANKNAVIRYKYLDELLSDKHHYYDIHELTAKCNARLERDGYLPVRLKYQTSQVLDNGVIWLRYLPAER